MNRYIVTMDADNHIKIPDDILKKHGLTDGDTIEVDFL